MTSERCYLFVCLRFSAGQLQHGETTFLMYAILILQTKQSSTFEFPWEPRNVHPTKNHQHFVHLRKLHQDAFCCELLGIQLSSTPALPVEHQRLVIRN